MYPMKSISSKILNANVVNLMVLVETNNKCGIELYINNFPPGVDDAKKSTAFLYACKLGRIEIAKLLLDCVNPNSRYGDGQTALMLFAQIGCDLKDKAEFLELLIERGCETDLVDCCGKLALHWAVIKDCSWSTRILMNRCNVNSADLIGMTPLMYAAKYNLCAIVSLLLHAGADPSKSSKQQGSAIHITIRHKATGALQQMIPFFRHLNIFDARNQSPMDLATLFDNLEIVKILIDSKKEIEINRRPSFAPFRTPLEEACFKNNIDIAKALISAGANVNHSLEFDFEMGRQSCRSMPVSPLMLAIMRQNVDLVELLISHGADIDTQCPKAPGYIILMTPLALAIELGNRAIIQLLENNLKLFEQSALGEAFKSACSWQNVDIVLGFLEKYQISLSQYRLKNGLPIMLELVKNYMNHKDVEKLLEFSKDITDEIFTPEVAQLLSRKSFGSSMQFYREAWLKLAIHFQLKIQTGMEPACLNFIISFLEYFFLKKKIDDLELIQEKLYQLKTFSFRLLRLAIHSSSIIKSILLSRSLYALIFLTEMHLDSGLVFWDRKSEEILDFCEFSLFFDNIDAALVINLTCGISLNCIIEYENFPYIPEIINPSIEYNDANKIAALKHLSKNVKPLKTLVKYAIRKSVKSDILISRLSGLSQSMSEDLCLDLSQYITYFENSQNSLVRYSDLCQWAGIDFRAYDFNEF